MVVSLQVTLRRQQVLLAKQIAASHATSSRVEGASTEAEVAAEAQPQAAEAWKSIDQLS